MVHNRRDHGCDENQFGNFGNLLEDWLLFLNAALVNKAALHQQHNVDGAAVKSNLSHFAFSGISEAFFRTIFFTLDGRPPPALLWEPLGLCTGRIDGCDAAGANIRCRHMCMTI